MQRQNPIIINQEIYKKTKHNLFNHFRIFFIINQILANNFILLIKLETRQLISLKYSINLINYLQNQSPCSQFN